MFVLNLGLLTSCASDDDQGPVPRINRLLNQTYSEDISLLTHSFDYLDNTISDWGTGAQCCIRSFSIEEVPTQSIRGVCLSCLSVCLSVIQ